MTTRFAGSRCVDERRRRRLAGEADEIDTAAETVSSYDRDDSASADDESAADELSSGDVRISHFPVSRLISPKLWKLWAVGILGLLTGINLLVAGSTTPATAQQFGPGFEFLFDLEAGRAVGPFATLMLLVSSQLAWFIWWVRSRSPHDFDGRYRVWCVCAVLGLGATLTFACDLHLAWAMTADWLWDYSFWKHETLIWLAPMALASLLALRALHREMRDCRSSLTLLWLAAISAAGVAEMQLDLVTLPLAANEVLLVGWGVKLTACWFLAMSLLLHARHVVHVTPDPAQRRPGLLRFASLIRLPKLPRRKRKAKPAATSKATDTADEQKNPKHKPTRKARKPVAATNKAKPDENKSDDSPSVADTSDEVDEVDDTSVDAEEPTPVETNQADEKPTTESIDAQSMQGLSKRERRRLRKQQRAEQRAAKSVRRAG
jgi:hypothetical protein